MSEEDKTRLRSLQRLAGQMRSAIDKLTGEQKAVTFEMFAKHYLSTKLENPTLRDSSKLVFKSQVTKHLIPAFGSMHLDKITNVEWLRWVMRMRNTTPNNRPALTKFFNSRKALVEILGAAKEEGLLEKLPKFDCPDIPSSTGRALEDKEILAVLWRAHRPFRFIFYVFWKMGCRPREILQWRWDMINLGEESKVWIEIPSRISKTGRTRSIPLNKLVGKLLLRRHHRLSQAGSMGEFVFPKIGDPTKPQNSYHSAWNRACRFAKVDAVVYDLRRTFITRCAAEGLPILYVAKCLDTSTAMIEKVYAKMDAKVLEGIVK